MGLPRSAQILYERLGPASTPTALYLRIQADQTEFLAVYLLVKAYQHFWLFRRNDACGDSHVLTILPL
jgi:hypothetical protein